MQYAHTTLCAAAILALACSAMADQLTVPTTEYPTIDAAVAAAVAGDEILLLDGVFTGEANWNLSVTVPITIRSASEDPMSVLWLGPSAGVFPLPEDRALTISAAVVLEGITFRQFAGDVGGAIYVDSGALTVENCRFENNYTGDEFGCQARLGGAIAAQGGDLTVRDTIFTGNRSFHPACSGTGTAEGGAVYVRDGRLVAIGCTFESNVAWGNFDGGGGAIATRDADVVIRGCDFVDNEAARSDFARGGAISARGGTLSIARSRLEGNRCEAFEGASGGGLSATGSTVLSSVALVDNTAHGTVAASGGGAFLAGTIEGSNLLVAGNGVTQLQTCDPSFGEEALGGGLYLRGQATLAHATIDGNTAECRGDNVLVAPAGSLALANSVLRGDYEGAVTAEYSNIEGGLPGAGNIDAAPIYQPGSLRLASGSPGVDAGSVGLIPADALDLDGDGDTTEPLPADLDGLARRSNDPASPDTGSGPAPIPDMGAYELQGCPADFDGDSQLTLFDFLAFQNAFDAGDPRADFDGDGELTLFDFLAFQSAFDAGCD